MSTKTNNKRIKNTFANRVNISEYSDDLIDMDDEAERIFGRSSVKIPRKTRFD